MKSERPLAVSRRSKGLCPRSRVISALGLGLLPALALGQTNYTPYTFTTLAGSASVGSADGAGTVARFHFPRGVAVDRAGNVYVTDFLNGTIRKITSDGIVTTLAGSAGRDGSTDGTGAAASFSGPDGIALDASGNLYVADSGGNTIRKITPEGVVSTLAGSPGHYGPFFYPRGVAVEANGNVYVADSYNNLIRKVAPDGTVSTLAGNGSPGYADGPAHAASFAYPSGVAVDVSGNVFVADTDNNTIRKITADGMVTTVAGMYGPAGSADGQGGAARFNFPTGVIVDGTGNIYVADSGNDTIRKITPAGVVTTLAGLAESRGGIDGIGSAARFDGPADVVADAGGIIYVADARNNAIRKIAPGGVVTTLAGAMPGGGSTDGPADLAQFAQPYGVAVAFDGNTYVADTANHTIRKVTPTGTVTTLAGLAGVSGAADGVGSAARFNHPQGIAIDASGSIFVADTGNHTVREISPDGTVTTVAGSVGDAGLVDGPADTARFSQPNSLAVDLSDNIYVLDSGNARIRKISSSGFVTSLSLYLSSPWALGLGGIAVDVAGDVYATMRFYGEGFGVFQVTPAGILTAVTRSLALVDSTVGSLALDAAGNVYVTNNVGSIHRITPDGVVSTMAGTNTGGYADGTGTSALFRGPRGIGVDPSGTVYVADTGNNVIRQGRPYPLPLVTRDPANRTVTAGQNAAFSVGEGSCYAATLQWQRLPANGTIWVDLRDDGTFGGTITTTLTVATATTAMNGDSFRCVVTNANGSAVSDPAALTVLTTTPFTVITLAGSPGFSGSEDGAGSAARFNAPADLALDDAGNLYVADANNHEIRRVTPAGNVTTLAGVPNSPGYADGTVSSARFAHPTGVGVDHSGNIYVSDTDNSVVRQITPGGMVTTLAGLAHTPGSADGTGSAARFNGPSGIVADGAGNLYVSDTLNRLIRKITPDGTVTTPVGHFGLPSPLSGPQGLALTGSGDLFVANTNSNNIQKVVLATAALTTVAGTWSFGRDDGAAASAEFGYPCGVAVDAVGNLYVADTDNHTIRRITTNGVVTTIAGLSGASGSADGIGPAARFNYPTGIAADAFGNLYIADTNNHAIRLAYVSAAPAITTQPQSQTLTAGASAQFSVSVTGRPVLAFRWHFNGTAIAGATRSTLNLTYVQPSNTGNYTVTVTNDSGSVTSNAATLTVNAAPGGSTAGAGASSGGGGGGMECWFAGLLALLAAALVRARKGPARFARS